MLLGHAVLLVLRGPVSQPRPRVTSPATPSHAPPPRRRRAEGTIRGPRTQKSRLSLDAGRPPRRWHRLATSPAHRLDQQAPPADRRPADGASGRSRPSSARTYRDRRRDRSRARGRLPRAPGRWGDARRRAARVRGPGAARRHRRGARAHRAVRRRRPDRAHARRQPARALARRHGDVLHEGPHRRTPAPERDGRRRAPPPPRRARARRGGPHRLDRGEAGDPAEPLRGHGGVLLRALGLRRW